jgi:hypothetical protein
VCLHYESAVCARFELTNDDYTPNKAAAAAAQRAHNHEYLILSYANPRDEAVLSRLLLMRYLSAPLKAHFSLLATRPAASLFPEWNRMHRGESRLDTLCFS